MEVKVIQIDTSKAQQDVDKLSNSIKSLQSNVDTVNKNLATGFKTGGKALEDFKNTGSKTGQVMNDLSSKLNGTGKSLNGLSGMLSSLTQGLGGAASGVSSLSKQLIALIANPIGAAIAAIVVVVKQLVEAFKRSEEGMAAIQKLSAPFKAVFQSIQRIFDDVVKSLTSVINKLTETGEGFNVLEGISKVLSTAIGAVSGVIKVLVRNTTNMIEGIKSLGTNISNFVKNSPLEGFLNSIVSGFNKLKESAIDAINTIANSKLGKLLGWDIIVDSIKEAVENTDELTESNKNLINSETELNKLKRENTVKNAKDEQKIAKLRAEAADKERYSAEERLKKLEESNKIELSISQRRKKEAELELQIIKERNSQTESGTQDLQAEAEAQAKVTKATTDYYNTQRRLQKEISAAQKEINAENNKLLEDTKKQAEELLKIQEEQLKREDLSDEDRLKRQLDIEQERLTLYTEGTLEYETQLTRISDLQKQIDNNAANNIQSLKDQLKGIGEEEEEKSPLEQLQEEKDKELEILKTSYEQELISEEEYQLRKQNIEKKYAEESQQLLVAQGIAKAKQYASFANSILSIGETIASAFADESEEAFEAQKAFQIGSSIINTLVGVGAAIAGLFTSKSGPWDIALAAIQAASIAASGVANIAKISKTKFGDTNSSSLKSTGSVSSNAVSVIPPTQYSQAVQSADLENKMQDIKVYVTEEDITNTQRKVSVQESENRF